LKTAAFEDFVPYTAFVVPAAFYEKKHGSDSCFNKHAI
jgi:hypothetical protein